MVRQPTVYLTERPPLRTTRYGRVDPRHAAETCDKSSFIDTVTTGRPRAKWTDQLRRDDNNVAIATLWRQTTGRGHSRATPRSEPTTR